MLKKKLSNFGNDFSHKNLVEKIITIYIIVFFCAITFIKKEEKAELKFFFFQKERLSYFTQLYFFLTFVFL